MRALLFSFGVGALGLSVLADPAPNLSGHAANDKPENYVASADKRVPCAKPDPELGEDLQQLSLSNASLRNYLSLPVSERGGHPETARLMQIKSRLMGYFKTHDPRTCLSDGWEGYHFICGLLAGNFPQLTLKASESRKWELVLEGRSSDGKPVEFHRDVTSSHSLGAAWKVYKANSRELLGSINVGSNTSSLLSGVQLEQWGTQTSIEKYFGHDSISTDAIAKSVYVDARQMNVDPGQACNQSPQATWIAATRKALAKGYDSEKSFDKAAGDVKSDAWLTGAHHGFANVGDAAASVPEGLVGIKHLVFNDQVESVSPHAVPCQDPQLSGKKCIGLFNLTVETYGPRIQAAFESCYKISCPSCQGLSGGVIYASLSPIAANVMNACIIAKGTAAIGVEAWTTLVGCASNLDKASRCFSQAAVITGGAAATAGIGALVSRGSIGLGTTLSGLVQSGKISGTTANLLMKLTQGTAWTVNTAADFSLNYLPADPKKWAKLGLADLQALKARMPNLKEMVQNDAKLARKMELIEKGLDEEIAKSGSRPPLGLQAPGPSSVITTIESGVPTQ